MQTTNWTLRLVGIAAAGLAMWYIAQLRGEIADLDRRLAAVTAAGSARPAAPAAAAAPAAPAPVAAAPGPPRTITEGQRFTMINALSRGGMFAGSPVWFATVPNDPEAAAFQKELQSVFEEAGWKVMANNEVRFQMKPGIFVFAADVDPPDYVDAINDAFESVGIELAGGGRGYREYFRERKQENPAWIGFEMSDDQTSVIAIGRNPPEPAP